MGVNTPDFWTLNQTFESAGTLNDVQRLLFRDAAHLGFSYIACCNHVDPIKTPSRAVMMTNYPTAWVNHFSERQYVEICPVMRLASRQLTPFLWSGDQFLSTLDRTQRRVMGEGSEFGLEDGATFPMHDRRGVHGSCSVAFERGARDPSALNQIQRLALFAYERAVQLGGANEPDPPRLSYRERQCLRFAADGCKDFAIAQTLGIAEGTVHNIFRNILRKYHAATRTQALFIAIKAGEISPDGFINE